MNGETQIRISDLVQAGPAQTLGIVIDISEERQHPILISFYTGELVHFSSGVSFSILSRVDYSERSLKSPGDEHKQT
jgi:hypothetical protein